MRTEKAIMLGLAGCLPETVDPDDADRRVAEIKAGRRLPLTECTQHPVQP